MKTGISSFCEACSEALAALPAALESAAAELVTRGSEGSLAAPLAATNDLRARLRSLVDKLASQQAYLLIFGPLKSGKSTLMNAISGALCERGHLAPRLPVPRLRAARGEEAHFRHALQWARIGLRQWRRAQAACIADSHIALAQQIREAEQRQVPFDPTADFPEAIRRIDVKLPVPSLAESSTVLVDTPGLYSRMNFGYDMLTREFRNSAACAVFVVKTDNLFPRAGLRGVQPVARSLQPHLPRHQCRLQQARPPGGWQLRPSAESRDPEQIVEAFTTLSMAGPLRQAYEQNRVRIHALDLLNAASERILAPAAAERGGADGHAPALRRLHRRT